MHCTANQPFLLSSAGRFFALGGGLGLAPRAPGTVGTLGGYVLAAPLVWLPLPLALAGLLVLFVWGCYICDEAGDALGVPDHGSIVWDEIVAMALVLCCIPISIAAWVAAFVVFRFFDIVKPWPIGMLDARFKNGFGVMVDDLLAALFSLLVLFAVPHYAAALF